MKKYCIFSVFDYKGGELNSRINLTREGLAGKLAEEFEGHIDFDSILSLSSKRDRAISQVLDQDSLSILDELKKEILEVLNSGEFYSIYAGGDGFCGEVYEVENSKLKEVNISEFVDDIAKYIIENWLD